MVSFISRKLDEEVNLGKVLKDTREKSGFTIERISIILGINAKYLAAFEENKTEDLPEGIYADKFLKRYAQFLGLDEKIILFFPLNDSKLIKEERCRKVSCLGKIKNFIFHPAFLKNSLAIFILLLGSVYLFSIVYKIVKPPKLTIVRPNDDLITQQYTVAIEGATEKEAKIFINNKEVFCSARGEFQEQIDLKKGLNVVKITAKKKYSKESVAYRKILMEDGNVSLK